MEVTLEQFLQYVTVQESGATNMFDIRNVAALSGLDRQTILYIMEHYDELSKQYPDSVR